jgi:hypothetical protein
VATRKLGNAIPSPVKTRTAWSKNDPDRDAEEDRPPEREQHELERARRHLLDDVGHAQVPEGERRPEIERHHALQVVAVLLVPRKVEAVLLALISPNGRWLIVAVLDPSRVREPDELSVPERIAADRPHHEKDDRDDDPEHGDRPKQATQDETGHDSEGAPILSITTTSIPSHHRKRFLCSPPTRFQEP